MNNVQREAEFRLFVISRLGSYREPTRTEEMELKAELIDMYREENRRMARAVITSLIALLIGLAISTFMI